MTHHDNSASGLSRPAFFDRQSLSAEDLNCLVEYVRNERRRHNRNVVGWGVTNGLPVTAHAIEPWQLEIGAGHAIAPSGQEIEVPAGAAAFDICEAARACLDIPGPCPDPFDLTAGEGVPGLGANRRTFDFAALDVGTRFENPLEFGFAQLVVLNAAGGPLPSAQIEELISTRGLGLDALTRIRFEQPINRFRLTLARSAVPPRIIALAADGNIVDAQMLTAATLSPQTLTLESTDVPIVEIQVIANGGGVFLLDLAIPRDTTVVGQVFLAICPAETPQCFKPGIPEHCMPPGDNVHPARICEGYRFEVLCNLPDGTALPSCDEIEPWLCEDSHIPVPPVFDLDCVVLAAVSVGNDGILAVDEFTPRRKLPPLWVTAAHGACCCCGDAPAPTPTPPPTPTPTPPPTDLTQFTQFTLITDIIPSTITRFTDIVPSSITRFTDIIPSTITRFTDIIPSSITRFTDIVPSTITRFTDIVQPSFISDIVQPSFISEIVQPSFIIDGPGERSEIVLPSAIFDGPIGRSEILGPGAASEIVVVPGGNGGLEFDRLRGRELEVTALGGVGTRRRDTLRHNGIANLSEFIEHDSESLSRMLGMSEVRIARMQDEARALTREPRE